MIENLTLERRVFRAWASRPPRLAASTFSAQQSAWTKSSRVHNRWNHDEGRPRDQSQEQKSALMRSKKAHRKEAHGFSPPVLLDRSRQPFVSNVRRSSRNNSDLRSRSTADSHSCSRPDNRSRNRDHTHSANALPMSAPTAKPPSAGPQPLPLQRASAVVGAATAATATVTAARAVRDFLMGFTSILEPRC